MAKFSNYKALARKKIVNCWISCLLQFSKWSKVVQSW